MSSSSSAPALDDDRGARATGPGAGRVKALILSGGKGSRLRPITHTSAKQLIPVANKPILFYALEHMRQAGIVDVGIVVGTGRPAEEVRAAVGDGAAWGLDVSYIEQAQPLGLAHAVLVARAFLGDDDFVMYLGDNVLVEGIAAFVEEFERQAPRPSAQIFLARVPEPERFGVAVLDGERVVRLVEKPRERLSDLALVGVYLFDRTVHEAVSAIRPSARGELEITDAIQWLVDAGRPVRAHMVAGWWKDTGRLEDLLEANRLLLETLEPRVEGGVDDESSVEGAVVVEAGAKVARSRLVGPCVVGAGAIVEDSAVGPYASISEGTEVRRSEVEDAIVMEHCVIEGVHGVRGSLLGKKVEVRGMPHLKAGYRLMLGDRSQVSLG